MWGMYSRTSSRTFSVVTTSRLLRVKILSAAFPMTAESMTLLSAATRSTFFLPGLEVTHHLFLGHTAGWVGAMILAAAMNGSASKSMTANNAGETKTAKAAAMQYNAAR